MSDDFGIPEEKFANYSRDEAWAVLLDETADTIAERRPLMAEAKRLQKQINRRTAVFCKQFGFKMRDIEPIIQIALIEEDAARDDAALRLFDTTTHLLPATGYTPEKLAEIRAREEEGDADDGETPEE